MMARAIKIIDGEIQIEPFMPTLAAWVRKALSSGEAVKISAITETDEEFDTPKSDSQREKFHALIGDINKTGVIKLPGRRIVMSDYDQEQCKALLVMWFVNEIKEMNDPNIKIPNPPRSFDCPITGQTITIRPSTIKWGKKLTCLFVEFLYATGTDAGTVWNEPAMKAYQEYREAQK